MCEAFVHFNICHRISDIFLQKLKLFLIFIPFGLHNFSSSFYYISDIILFLVFIQFYENIFSFYLVLRKYF